MEAPSAAAGVSRASWPAMRVLHARHADHRARLPEHQSRPRPKTRSATRYRRCCAAAPGMLILSRRSRRRRDDAARPNSERHGQRNRRHAGSYVGRSLLRREDRRLLTGRGQFIADLDLPGMLHAVFVRSPVAHARIRSVDLSRAAAAPGVACALSGADLAQLLPPVPDTQLSLPSKWTTQVQHKVPQPAAAAAGARQGAACRRGGRGHRRREPLCSPKTPPHW